MPEINLLGIIINLIITITIYSLPIIITRYVILRRPVGHHNAKIITLIYAFFALLIMVVVAYLLTSSGTIEKSNTRITGVPLVLWSYINYKMLTSSNKKRHSNKSNSEGLKIFEETTPNSKVQKSTYCKQCGSLINGKTKKCSGCGKQYFKFSKLVFIWCVLAVLVIGLGGLNVYQYLEYQALELSSTSQIQS